MVDHKFSAGSQKIVGVGQPGSFSQQAIQRHNFLLPKDGQDSLQLPSYRDQENKKSKSPMTGTQTKFDNSLNQH